MADFSQRPGWGPGAFSGGRGWAPSNQAGSPVSGSPQAPCSLPESCKAGAAALRGCRALGVAWGNWASLPSVPSQGLLEGGPGCFATKCSLWSIGRGVGDAAQCGVQVWAELLASARWTAGSGLPCCVLAVAGSAVWLVQCGLSEGSCHSCWGWAMVTGLSPLCPHLLCTAVLDGLKWPQQAALRRLQRPSWFLVARWASG